MTTLEHVPTLVEMPSPRVMPTAAVASEIVYPESDGQPIADNTKQFDTIVKIYTGVTLRFRNDPNVFVAGDLLWYPVEGDNTLRIAPDVMVAFGRPKGDRRSYLQWREGGVAPQVVFETMSPKNTWWEMAGKQRFYERFGVEEYYRYDLCRGKLAGWLAGDSGLKPIEEMEGWVSPRLDVTFRMTPEGEWELYHPDGRRFETAVELAVRADEAYQRAEEARQEAERQRAKEAQRQAEEAHTRAERLAAKLRELGIDPDEQPS